MILVSFNSSKNLDQPDVGNLINESLKIERCSFFLISLNIFIQNFHQMFIWKPSGNLPRITP